MDTADDDVLFSRGPLSAFQVIKLMTKNNWVNKQKVIFPRCFSGWWRRRMRKRNNLRTALYYYIFFQRFINILCLTIWKRAFTKGFSCILCNWAFEMLGDNFQIFLIKDHIMPQMRCSRTSSHPPPPPLPRHLCIWKLPYYLFQRCDDTTSLPFHKKNFLKKRIYNARTLRIASEGTVFRW